MKLYEKSTSGIAGKTKTRISVHERAELWISKNGDLSSIGNSLSIVMKSYEESAYGIWKNLESRDLAWARAELWISKNGNFASIGIK